jgi:hypothetical protein
MSPIADLSKRSRAIWSLIAAFIFLSAAAPTAQGLDFPATTRLNLPETKSTSITLKRDIHFEEGAVAPVKLSEMAKVAILARQVEMSRTPYGAKMVTKAIMAEDYGWMDTQFTCLNRLWTKESNWNYKAHNYKSGAHGIPQALPASKMDVVGTDWRTNAVTQIRWGLRYIEDRYKNPCGAWKKFQRSRYY